MTPLHPLWLDRLPLVLASGSIFRRQLLEAAEIPHVVRPAAIDERQIEASLQQAGAGPDAIARGLAEAKAVAAKADPAEIVLGCDQTLALAETMFHKPHDRAAAAGHLRRLSGKTHALHSGLALVRGGRLLWSHTQSAHLTMRPLDEAMITAYLDAAGDRILSSVGAYQLEHLGIHLFDRIEGDQSTIIGLPLLPLLAALRRLLALRV
jgi:septum formation protein